MEGHIVGEGVKFQQRFELAHLRFIDEANQPGPVATAMRERKDSIAARLVRHGSAARELEVWVDAAQAIRQRRVR